MLSSCALLGATLILAPAHSAPTSAVKGLPAAKLPQLAPLIDAATQLLDLADRLTTRTGQGDVRMPLRPTLEAVQWRVVYRVRRVEVANFLTNEIIGFEIPGRRIRATICTDILVNYTLDLNKVHVRQDPDYPDTWEVLLPGPTVTAAFPDGELADYAVDYAALRVPFLNRGTAAELRTKMYGTAREKAREMYGKDVQPSLQYDLLRDLRILLRKQFPNRRINVRFGS